MLSPDTARKRAPVYRTKTLILLVFVASVAALVGAHLSASPQGTDFPDFYCAARMLAEGHGHQLYDPEVQRQYQARYAGGVGTLYIHPPFEAALYLAVAWLPLRRAYLLWFLLNLAFLTAGARLMAKEALVPWDWRMLLAASLTFVPALLCLLQGQDSLLLLLLVILAFTALRSQRAFSAGCWLGLGLFKFQIMLPLVLALALTRSGKGRSSLAKGFSLVALALAGMSAAISGWSILTGYPASLLRLQTRPNTGIAPQVMANFRGLAYLLFHRNQSPWAITAVLVLSAAALIVTLSVWKHAALASHGSAAGSTPDEFDFAFANTVLFALLVSYYLNPHDLSLLLLPISLLLHRTLARTSRPPQLANWMNFSWRGAWLGAWLGILVLPPLHLWALQAGVYALVGLPMLALFLTGASVARPARLPASAN